jgi:hypothetical protein
MLFTELFSIPSYLCLLFQPYIEIVLGKKFTDADCFLGLHDPEAAELRKWVDFIYSQVHLTTMVHSSE